MTIRCWRQFYVLEQQISSIFRVEKYAKQEPSRWKLLLPASAGFLLGVLFVPEAQQICSSENVDASSGYTASQPKILKKYLCLLSYYIKK